MLDVWKSGSSMSAWIAGFVDVTVTKPPCAQKSNKSARACTVFHVETSKHSRIRIGALRCRQVRRLEMYWAVHSTDESERVIAEKVTRHTPRASLVEGSLMVEAFTPPARLGRKLARLRPKSRLPPSFMTLKKSTNSLCARITTKAHVPRHALP